MKQITKEIAAQHLKSDSEDLRYFSWPQMFGSTCGPFKGIGGQVMTEFQIEAWEDPMSGKALIFCKGEALKIVEIFQPMNVRL